MWCEWKLWRFAWSNMATYRYRGTDLDGEWIHLIGKIWWLETPK